MPDLQLTVVRFPSAMGAFLRMLAHFDALDSDDDDPIAPLPRYELIHPEDSCPAIPDFVAEYSARMFWEFIYGPA